jgi:uncharacterized protein YegP (UPF0339 family)
MPARFVLKKTGAGRYYFVLQGPRGELLMSSESYTTKDAARRATEAIISSVSRTATVEDQTGDETGALFRSAGPSNSA